jgi:5-methylcytosine-specific restriction endonuclease McrA
LEWAVGHCVNCGAFLPRGRQAYCSELCQQVADVVRYRRATLVDGRCNDPDVEQAIRIKVAHVVAGGYDKRSRNVGPDLRVEVMAANDGRCVACGDRPATEVDHIRGPSNDRANLQGLCWSCHVAKTKLSMLPIPDHDTAKLAVLAGLFERFYSTQPLRVCDDKRLWDEVFPKVRQANRQLWADNYGLDAEDIFDIDESWADAEPIQWEL